MQVGYYVRIEYASAELNEAVSAIELSAFMDWEDQAMSRVDAEKKDDPDAVFAAYKEKSKELHFTTEKAQKEIALLPPPLIGESPEGDRHRPLGEGNPQP